MYEDEYKRELEYYIDEFIKFADCYGKEVTTNRKDGQVEIICDL